MAERKAFSSVKSAVLAAMQDAMDASKEKEYGGIIYEDGGKYYYTPPESSGKEGELKIKARFPKGSNLHGVYHTHPGGTDGSERFSAADVEIANKLKMPYYMGHSETRDVRAFIPGETETIRVVAPGGGRSQKEAIGDLLGNLKALDEKKEPETVGMLKGMGRPMRPTNEE